MTRHDALQTLRALEPSLRDQGLAHLYLFGSAARADASDASDIDVAFDIAPTATERFSLIDQSRIRSQLEAVFDVKVDFVERAYLRPRIAERAAIDMIQVF